MKFCQRKLYNIDNKTSTHYITKEDIVNFHGKDFYDQFVEFIKEKPLRKFGNEEGYYYIDYEICARQTDSFLNPKG